MTIENGITGRHRAPQIVLLNGVGSAGKTSIAKALQNQLTRPFLHISMDSFLDMLPARYHDHVDTFTYRQTMVDGFAEVVIDSGQLGTQVLRGMRFAVQAMASQGLNLIVDDVLMGSDDPGNAEYLELLSRFAFFKVGVFASLETLEDRERNRGDRMIGLARWQFDRVHSGMNYDLELHTDQSSPSELATQIQEALGL